MVPGGGRDATIDARAVVESTPGAIPVVRGPRGGRALACAGAWGSGGCPAAGAGGIDDLARATAQRRDARRRAGVPGHDGAVACRAGGAASEAGEAGDAPGAQGVCARPAGGCRSRSGRGCGAGTGGVVEGPAARAAAASALGEGMEPAADFAAAATRLPWRRGDADQPRGHLPITLCPGSRRAAARADGVPAHRAGTPRAAGAEPREGEVARRPRAEDQRAPSGGGRPGRAGTLGGGPDPRPRQFGYRHPCGAHDTVHDAAAPAPELHPVSMDSDLSDRRPAW